MKILNLYAGIGGNRKLWGDTHDITAVEFRDDIAGPLKGGTMITVKGDTIEFYGGTLTYSGFGSRSIRDIAINDLKEKGD